LLVATAILLADVVIVWIGVSADFAFDFTCCYQQAAERALTNPATLYDWSETYTFRYTPIGALVFVPLVPLSEVAAVWVWLLFKVAVLAIVAVWFSSRWSGNRRVLVALLALTFPPIVHDLVLGNVSTLTVLALLALARWHDGRGGVAIGLVAALMPKPHLVPVLVYLAIRRPRDFVASAGTVGSMVVMGLLIFGADPWIGFLGTLREPLERTFTANVGWSALLGPAGVGVGLIIGFIALVAGLLLGGARGYGLSILAGILAGPYTFIHYLSGSLVAVEPVLRMRPRWLVPFPWLLVVFPLIPLWLSALAAVVRASPPPPEEAAAPPATARG
jgi:hypothetical protein